MIPVIALIKRNLKLFLRDRMTVFFSFLSTLILIMLYFLFIAKTYTTGMDDPAAGGIGAAIKENAKYYIVYLQMMAGVLVLNSMSLTTGAFSTIANDFENKRIDSLLLTPVRTYEMILAYFTTGFIASFVINTFTWLLSFLIIGFVTGYWVTVLTFFAVIAVLSLASFVSCCFMMFVTALVKSSAAIGVFNGISGTFFGFLCGIYMPYSNLGEGPKTVGSFLPFTHLTIWLKQLVLEDAFAALKISGEFKDILSRDFFSAVSVGLGGLELSLWITLVLSSLLGLVCLAASYRILRGRIKGF